MREVICSEILLTSEGIEISFIDILTEGENTKAMIRFKHDEDHGYSVGKKYKLDVE
jgi:hypothetical protein